jgi:hypothetical protein
MPQSLAAIARSHPRSLPLLGAMLVLAALVLLLTAPPAPAQESYDYADYGSGREGYYDDDGAAAEYESGYSYVRNLRGDATLVQAGGERGQLEVNQPVLVGDRVWVAPGSMAELLLSDGNLLRLDGDTEVVFEALSGSPEARDASTVLRLLEGNLQLVVFTDALGREMPRVNLPNASLYVGDAGRYRLTSDRGDWSQVVVRSGWAEVSTRRGSEVVRAGGEALVEGEGSPRTVLRQAGGFDTLERWGERLDAQVTDSGYVDDSLRYAAAPLEDHGSWVYVDQRRAWRPQVTSDWYPYTRGRWRYTPIGLTWVSYEPWGWVPYHYGSWDHAPGYGWVWFPGRTFAPARVYWYWGPNHVAWVPYGYYNRHYGHRGHGFRFGVHGWVGGGWDLFADWAVCPTAYFGHRYQHRYVHDGRYWGRHDRGGHLPRGILTTDTRPLTPDRWHDPDGAIRALRTRPGSGAAGTRGGAAELPDVTAFVARKRDLPPEVERRVMVVDRAGGARRAEGEPLHTVKPRDGSRQPGIGEVVFDGGGGSRGQVTPRGGTPAAGAAGAAGSAGTGVGSGRAETPRRVDPRAGGTRPDGPRVIDRGGDEGRASGDDRSGAAGPRVVSPRGGTAGPSIGSPDDDRPSGQQAPRRVDPRAGDGGPSGQAAPRRVEPRSSGRRDDGASGSASPRRIEPRDSGGRDDDGDSRRIGAPRSAPAAADRGSAARDDGDRGSAWSRPRTVIIPGRSSGSGGLSSSPRFDGDSGDRRSGGTAARSPVTRSSGSRAVAEPAPRSERAGSNEPPARRVVGGVLSRPSGSSPAPSAERPSYRPPSRTPSSSAQRPSYRPPSSSAQRPSSSAQRPSSRPSAAPPSRSPSSRSSAGRAPVVRRPSSPPPSALSRSSAPSRGSSRGSVSSRSSSSSRSSGGRSSVSSRSSSSSRSSASSRSSSSRSSSSRSSSSRSSRGDRGDTRSRGGGGGE